LSDRQRAIETLRSVAALFFGFEATKRKSKSVARKSVVRKVKRRSSAKKAAPRKAKRSYDIHTGQPTGREVQAMHRLQVLTERYIAEGLTPADARTRAREELRANPRRDWRAG
jgi:hypothetical protein